MDTKALTVYNYTPPRTDGSFMAAQARMEYDTAHLLTITNDRLTKDGIKCKLAKTAGTISLQFSAPLREGDKPSIEGRSTRQYKLGCGCQYNSQGILQAEAFARQVGQRILYKDFTWEWFDHIVGKSPTATQEKTIADWLKSFEEFFWATHPNNDKSKFLWYKDYQAYLKFPKTDIPFSLEVLKEFLLNTTPNTVSRRRQLRTLRMLIDHAGLLPKYKDFIDSNLKKTKVKAKEKYIPSPDEIEQDILRIKPGRKAPKYTHENTMRWKYVLALQATYGLRIHECWNIENLYAPAMFKGKEIPALSDPENTKNLLVVGENTKTGSRLAMPISPVGKDWVVLFDLKNIKLPELSINREHKAVAYASAVSQFMNRHNFKYTSHALRHACNHTARTQGIGVHAISLSLGHTEEMNSTVYKQFIRPEMIIDTLEKGVEAQVLNASIPKIPLEQAFSQISSRYASDPEKFTIASEVLSLIYGLPSSPEEVSVT
jgi:integrase